MLALATILFLSYNLIGKEPKKQTAYDFFHPSKSNTSPVRGSVTLNSSHATFQQGIRKKPHLLVVQGLADLYLSVNVSVEESRSLLVWAEMRPLLSRSDSLPDIVEGIKEAASAWKELLSVVSEARNISDENPGWKDCPHTVTSFNSNLSSNGNILHIPCGLIEDSSVTVIGIPDGKHGSFQIQLQGSQVLGEAMPTVVLNYAVHLPGDNVTDEPLVIQNTWSSDLGWGKEEICPDYRSNHSIKVDGFVKCNALVIRSSTKVNVNVSHPVNHQSTNISVGSGHVSANFPFVEGNAFTATLWTGAEGFHMTVNGRHETSFAYREKFEPWMVNDVKVEGGLQMMSALAKGLPYSEYLTSVLDIEHLKAPPVLKKRILMFIGVFSTGNNFERRMALRRSWMQYDAVRSGNVAVRFFIGLHKNLQVNLELWKEAQAFGDIQLMPFVDYYSLLSLKTISICIMGTKILSAKYVMKTDDDAFVRIDVVLLNLKGMVPDGLLYGLISFESSPQREKDNKWYISSEEWAHDSYPPWAHGPGYIMSRDIAKFIVQGHQQRDLQFFKLEDVAVGIWVEQFKKQGRKVQYISDEKFYNAGCETNYTLAHYQNPRMVLCLWENLQKEHEPNCCE